MRNYTFNTAFTFLLNLKKTQLNHAWVIRSLTCHHVIVTTPLGVLQRHQDTMFTPGLEEEKVRAITRMGAGRISKIFLEWDSPWWIRGQLNLNLGNFP